MGGISIAISIVALAVSGATLWLTHLRRGHLAMTKPAIVFFGYDAVPITTAKIFVRTLLYSTANQGQVIESMHAVVRHQGTKQAFSFWGYGETEKLSAGSGLYVSRTGLAANHHFVLSVHEPEYVFTAGPYEIEVYAQVVGQARPRLLGRIALDLSPDLATALAARDGVLFERMPDGIYRGHARGVDQRHAVRS